MGAPAKLGAAFAGLAVAFVAVMLLQSLTPDPDLNTGKGRSDFQRFQFEEGRTEFTEGSTVRLHNGGGVAVTFEVLSPEGSTARIELSPGASRNLTLRSEGTYTVTALEFSWVETKWVVRSANPFERFFEDLV